MINFATVLRRLQEGDKKKKTLHYYAGGVFPLSFSKSPRARGLRRTNAAAVRRAHRAVLPPRAHCDSTEGASTEKYVFPICFGAQGGIFVRFLVIFQTRTIIAAAFRADGQHRFCRSSSAASQGRWRQFDTRKYTLRTRYGGGGGGRRKFGAAIGREAVGALKTTTEKKRIIV